MTVLRARPSVCFDIIAPAGFRILSALDQATIACHVDLVITCGSDSHPPADPHTTGEAYDVSVQALSAQNIADLHMELVTILGPLFTVLYEVPSAPSDPTLRSIAYVNREATGPHLHIQRKRGTIYPPALAVPRTVLA